MPGRASASSESKLPDGLFKAMQSVLDTLYTQTDEDGRDISEMYHVLVPKRTLPDYYRVIKTPMAMNMVQNSVKKKIYSSFAGFVRDCAQIFHNAKVYNRPGSMIYNDAVTLEGVLQSELRRLNNEGKVEEQDTQLPDLGPIPPPSPSVSQAGTPEPEEEPSEDEEEDDEEDSKRRTRRRRAPPKREATLDDDDADVGRTESRRKRGRPPRVDTPMECRIKNIMKGLRKARDEEGNLRVTAFERLPDPKQFPDYYDEIKNPIALDIIKRKIKRREYKSVEQFEADVRLMCENAKLFNEDESDIFKDACALLEELHTLAEIEKVKNDSELQGGMDSNYRQGAIKQQRIPLDFIEHKGEKYVIGDWVHLVNPNDLSKPTVAQIFRTWQDPDGQRWINACWYYRPEQTVHRYDRKFYEHEVVKTGQYRDHQIDEVINKCFVMFFTRYSRGRPKGIGNRQVYVCESRYNEVEKHFNKIKTWKSCIPDEVRGQDYEMDLFEKQEPLRKFPSPIAHLLPANALEDDPIPEAKMGAENGPPVVGAVFRRPAGPNNSPPPEASPPPQSSAPARQTSTPAKPAPPPPEPQQADYHENLSMTQMYKQAHAAAASTHTAASPQPPQPSVAPVTPIPQMHHHRPPVPPQHIPMTQQYSQPGPHGTPLMRQGSVHQPYVQHSPSPHVPQMYPVPQIHHHHLPQGSPQHIPQGGQAVYANMPQYAVSQQQQPMMHHPQHQIPPQQHHYSPHPQQAVLPQQQPPPPHHPQQYTPQPPPQPLPQHIPPQQHLPPQQHIPHAQYSPMPPQPQYAPPPTPMHHAPQPPQMHYVPPPPQPQPQPIPQPQPQQIRHASHPPPQQSLPPAPQPQQQPQYQHLSSPPPTVLPPSTFILPDSTTSGIPESIAQQFLRDDEGRILWFSVPPMETSGGSSTPTIITTVATVPSSASSTTSGDSTPTAVSGKSQGSTSSAATAGGGPKIPSHSLEYLARRSELLAKKRKRRMEREKEELEKKRKLMEEGKRERKEVEKALGKVLRVWERQLRV